MSTFYRNQSLLIRSARGRVDYAIEGYAEKPDFVPRMRVPHVSPSANEAAPECKGIVSFDRLVIYNSTFPRITVAFANCHH